MAEINLVINNRNYGVYCDDGQEQRVAELGHYIDSRLKEIAAAGAANNDNHLLVLTALVMADELFEARQSAGQTEGPSAGEANGMSEQDEAQVVQAISTLADRIDLIADRLQRA